MNSRKTQKYLFFPNYCSKQHSLFPTKESFVQMEFFGNFSSKWQIYTVERAPHSLVCHWSEVFLNFLSFPPFRIGSIAQNKKFLISRKVWMEFVNFDQLGNFEGFRCFTKDFYDSNLWFFSGKTLLYVMSHILFLY